MNLTRKIKFSDVLPVQLEVKIVLIVTWSGESLGTLLLNELVVKRPIIRTGEANVQK